MDAKEQARALVGEAVQELVERKRKEYGLSAASYDGVDRFVRQFNPSGDMRPNKRREKGLRKKIAELQIAADRGVSTNKDVKVGPHELPGPLIGYLMKKGVIKRKRGK